LRDVIVDVIDDVIVDVIVVGIEYLTLGVKAAFDVFTFVAQWIVCAE